MPPAPPSLLDLLGIIVAAVSGVLTAGRRGMDLFGVLVLATVTAIGGGTVRDLLLDRRPIFWIAWPSHLLVILAAAIGTMIYTRIISPPGRALLFADAGALALFAIAGAQVAEAAHVHAMIVVTMGTITGVVGGMLRDVLANEVPMVLRQDVYATAAILGVTVYHFLLLVLPQGIAALIAMVLIVLIRVAAIQRQLHLPLFTFGDDDRSHFRQTRDWTTLR